MFRIELIFGGCNTESRILKEDGKVKLFLTPEDAYEYIAQNALSNAYVFEQKED